MHDTTTNESAGRRLRYVGYNAGLSRRRSRVRAPSAPQLPEKLKSEIVVPWDALRHSPIDRTMADNERSFPGVGGPTTADLAAQIRALSEALAAAEAALPRQLGLLAASDGGANRTVEHLRDRLFAEVYIPGERRNETIRVVRSHWERVLEVLRGVDVRDLERAHAIAVRDRYASNPPTANGCLNAFSAGCTWAERWGWRSQNTNPCTHVRRFKVRRRAVRLPLGELRRVVDVMLRRERDGRSTALIVALLTGMRRSEAQRLRVKAVDLDCGCIRLAEEESKTGERLVPLSDAAIAILSDQLRRLPEASVWAFPRPNDPSKPIGRGDDHWNEIRTELGMPNLRRHDLRHAFVTTAARAGRTFAQIRPNTGHSNDWMVEYYADLDLGDGLETANAVARQLGFGEKGRGGDA